MKFNHILDANLLLLFKLPCFLTPLALSFQQAQPKHASSSTTITTTDTIATTGGLWEGSEGGEDVG